MVTLFATTVNAAETNNLAANNAATNGFNDLTDTLSTNSGNTNNASNTANTNTNNNNNNSGSIYNNTNLPYTGVADSLPVAALVVVFGISAVYAYKKIKEYKNI